VLVVGGFLVSAKEKFLKKWFFIPSLIFLIPTFMEFAENNPAYGAMYLSLAVLNFVVLYMMTHN